MEGFLYNSASCLFCHACELACQEAHELTPGHYYRRVERLPDGEGNYVLFSGSCNHCERPVCVEVCRSRAMLRQDDGIVVHDDGACIGCGACYWSCPYGAVTFVPSEGIAGKCDSCVTLREKGQSPICVQACPVHALQWGELPAERESSPYLPDPGRTLPRLSLSAEREAQNERG